MNKLQKLFALAVLFTAASLGACSQDETMDEILDNTEINSPAPSNDGTDDDEPGGGG